MREKIDNSAAMQKGNENNAEATLLNTQDDAATQRNDLNNSSEGMMYLDIIPRFAL